MVTSQKSTLSLMWCFIMSTWIPTVVQVLVLINPLRMRKRVTVVCLSVCLLPHWLLYSAAILTKYCIKCICMMIATFLTRGFC